MADLYRGTVGVIRGGEEEADGRLMVEVRSGSRRALEMVGLRKKVRAREKD